MGTTGDRQKDLLECLKNNDTSKFFIEWGGYRSNHLAHGLMALNRLGADRGRLEKYIERVQERLEPPDGETARGQICPEDEKDGFPHPGTQHSYYKRLRHYKDQLDGVYGGDLALLVGSEFPKLSPGLAATALHGLIQLGYGFSCGSAGTVCEGLAFLHHSYLPVNVPEGINGNALWEGTRNILDVIEDIRQDKELFESVMQQAKINRQKDPRFGPFTTRMRILLSSKAGELIKYAHQIQLPEYEDFRSVYKWVLDCAIHVYVRSESVNEFFLLHGVTGAWSLLQILPALKQTSDVIGAIVTLVITLLAVYITEECPALNQSPGADLLKYKEWEEIKETAVSGDYDTHVYKLVQVVHDLATEGADGELDLLYRSVANIALNNDFSRPER